MIHSGCFPPNLTENKLIPSNLISLPHIAHDKVRNIAIPAQESVFFSVYKGYSYKGLKGYSDAETSHIETQAEKHIQADESIGNGSEKPLMVASLKVILARQGFVFY